jgi:hypothetical protein
VAPDRGVNALKGAALAIIAIDAQRETFRDADAIRVHPILTKGGAVVNAVPATAELEMYVRGRSTSSTLARVITTLPVPHAASGRTGRRAPDGPHLVSPLGHPDRRLVRSAMRPDGLPQRLGALPAICPFSGHPGDRTERGWFDPGLPRLSGAHSNPHPYWHPLTH